LVINARLSEQLPKQPNEANPVSMAIPSVQLEFSADRHVTRWRPLVHWLMSVPHLMVANTLSSLQGILTLISSVTVLFTKEIPRPLFDAIAMTYRYDRLRVQAYVGPLTDRYPTFALRA
jgi:hypothetical protein